MKVIVALKQVPVRDSTLRIDSQHKWIEKDDLTYEINEPDAYALEEALLLKDQHGGEVVVLCAGPERHATIIMEVEKRDGAVRDVADYGIVGDLFEVVPALTAAVRKVKSG